MISSPLCNKKHHLFGLFQFSRTSDLCWLLHKYIYIYIYIYYYLLANVNDSSMHELNSRQTPFYHSLSLNPGKNTTSVDKSGFLIYVYKKFVNNICIIVILILTNIPMLLTIHYAISSFEW